MLTRRHDALGTRQGEPVSEQTNSSNDVLQDMGRTLHTAISVAMQTAEVIAMRRMERAHAAERADLPERATAEARLRAERQADHIDPEAAAAVQTAAQTVSGTPSERLAGASAQPAAARPPQEPVPARSTGAELG
jgi:hypothetical protein